MFASKAHVLPAGQVFGVWIRTFFFAPLPLDFGLVLSSKVVRIASCETPLASLQSLSGRFGGMQVCGTVVSSLRPLNFGRSTSVWFALWTLTNRIRPFG